MVAAACAGFLIYKLHFLTFRYGDPNLYFYYAGHLFGGLIPYRDFFMADPPAFVLALAAIKLFIGQHWLWLQASPIFLHIVAAVMLYVISRKWKNPLSFLAPLFYLFSFSTLANSDYATGEELMIVFTLLALWLWDNRHIKSSALLWAMAGLTKLFAGAGLIGFFIFSLFEKERKKLLVLALTGIAATAVFMLPFILLSPGNALYSIVISHLSRPAGLDKAAVFAYFFQREWLLLILAAPGFMLTKKKLVLGPFLGLLVFFLLFSDVYYLYFQTLLPFLVLAATAFLGWIWSSYKNGPAYSLMLITAYVLFMGVSITFYHNNWLAQGKFSNAGSISAAVAGLPESYPLYGDYTATPLIALMSGRQIYKNYVDTDTIWFWAGRLDKEKIGREAAKDGVYLVARITDYPELGIKDTGFEEYFSRGIFDSYCKRVLDFPSESQGQDNKLAVYRCKN